MIESDVTIRNCSILNIGDTKDLQEKVKLNKQRTQRFIDLLKYAVFTCFIDKDEDSVIIRDHRSLLPRWRISCNNQLIKFRGCKTLKNEANKFISELQNYLDKNDDGTFRELPLSISIINETLKKYRDSYTQNLSCLIKTTTHDFRYMQNLLDIEGYVTKQDSIKCAARIFVCILAINLLCKYIPISDIKPEDT